jgi:hypothetical protein
LPAHATQEERDGDDTQVGLGLAAARRKKDQLDVVAVNMALVEDGREVEQDEGELEEAPFRRGVGVAFRATVARLERHRLIGELECLERLGGLREQRDALGDPLFGLVGLVHEGLRRLAWVLLRRLALLRWAVIQSPYAPTSGVSTRWAASPSASSARASILVSTPTIWFATTGRTTVWGIQVVRAQYIPVSSGSTNAAKPWPVAQSSLSRLQVGDAGVEPVGELVLDSRVDRGCTKYAPRGSPERRKPDRESPGGLLSAR